MKFSATLALITLAAAPFTLVHAAEQAPKDSLTIGGGVAVAPEYSGADKNRALPLVFVDYQRADGFFASSFRGLGYQSSVDQLNFSAALAFDAGRKEKRENIFSGSDKLKGMGDISPSAIAKLGLGYDLGPFSLSMGANLALTKRDYGNTYNFGLSMPLNVSKDDTITLSAEASYGDRKHAQTYYGVTAAQSQRSGYAAYQPKGGFEQTELSVNWMHKVDAHWSVRTLLGVSHLMGDAAKSPLTQKKTTPMAAATINYTF